MKKTSIKLSSILMILGLCLSLVLTSCKPAEDQDWVSKKVPSFKDSYSKIFDRVGFACEYGIKGWSEKELATDYVQQAMVKHSSTITMGNEFKPQFIMAWWGSNPQIDGTFTASNGLTIETPVLNGFGNVDAILEVCKKNNLNLRGHVLVWHSQTEEAFFHEDYDSSKPFASKEEMTAREEWYIKTVLDHMAEWEKNNNDGKHIIWAWDVVNEAIADGSSNLRSDDSNWYKIFGSSEFIINAFRFANKYAPADVLLTYNDYNCHEMPKRSGMLTLLDEIIAAEQLDDLPARIDVMGMQSHISKDTKTSDIQAAIDDFVAKGLDIHITELDIATEAHYDSEELANAYYNVFKTYVANRKTSAKNGITSITIWGLNDEATWLNAPYMLKWHQNTQQFPLLFEMKEGKYMPKAAFYSVIKAAKK